MKKIFIFIIIYPVLLHSQWIQQSIPPIASTYLSISFSDQNSGVAGGWKYNPDFTGKIIYTTNSGLNWLVSSIPDSTRSAVNIQMLNSSIVYMGGAYNSVLPPDKKFSDQISYLPSNIKNHYVNLGYTSPALYNSYKGMFMRSTNGGQSWAVINTLPANVFYVEGMKFVDVYTGYLGVSLDVNPNTKSAILKTTNSGASWNSLYTIDSAGLGNICILDANNILVGGEVHNGNYNGFILRSTNGGLAWQKQDFAGTTDFFYSFSFVNSTTGFTSNTYTSFDSYIYQTTNAGANWTRLNTVFPNTGFYDIGFVSGTGKGIAVGYKSYPPNLIIARTTDYALNWTSYILNDTTGLHSISLIDQNLWFVSGGDLFSYGKIFKSTTGGEIGILPISNEIPVSYSLYQNYPNPFNPSTKIKFDIPSVGNGRDRFVQIKMYDIAGREVETLVNETMNPGTYEVTFDASKYSSGVYFYKLTADNFTNIKKMVLIK